MKNKLTLLLAFALTFVNFGCASMRRHPVIYGMVGGAIVGTTVALVTRHNCPKMVNGYPYDGTPPCPNPQTYDPGGKK